MRSSTAKIAHYFDRDGNSACHLWTATTLDKPSTPGDARCPTCAEAVKHGLV